MWRNPLDMPIDDLATIQAPVLGMRGDDDGVRIEWNLASARALPRGQFAVGPGTGYGAPIQKPEVVNRVIPDFLADPAADCMMSMGSLYETPEG